MAERRAWPVLAHVDLLYVPTKYLNLRVGTR